MCNDEYPSTLVVFLTATRPTLSMELVALATVPSLEDNTNCPERGSEPGVVGLTEADAVVATTKPWCQTGSFPVSAT